ncbi:MAG: hypothetical protein JWQ22_978, partial [Devosia sp.]|nr:hypothetical protein [Devosia sp.]
RNTAGLLILIMYYDFIMMMFYMQLCEK